MPNFSENILQNVNDQQQEAIVYKEGPLLIIAGAGTGKTTVISRRIAWLVSEGLAKMEEILALTFTDKAAQEMTERVDILLPYGYTDVWISTFHAFGDRILRESALELGLNPDFGVLTKPESAIFFREHLFEFPLKMYRPLSNPTKFIETILDLFSRLRDEDITPGEYLSYAQVLSKNAATSNDEALKEDAQKHLEIAQTYAHYLKLLNEAGKVDFSNQFYLALTALRTHPSILARYQGQFKYILVDEFQDTNFAQFQLLKFLAAKHGNISVVSDDDQCIFRFRGAAYSNILNFIKEYPAAKQISLIQNYRSTQTILDTAYRLIQHNNPDRFEIKAGINKKLNGISSGGKPIEHLHFDTVSSEADGVAALIDERVKKGDCHYGDFAILVRSNNDADPFLRSLNLRDIPWRFSGNQGLYSKEEVRMCISFLRVMNDLNDSVNLFYLASSELYKMPLDDLSFCMHHCRLANHSLYFVFKTIKTNEQLVGTLSEKSISIIEKVVRDIEDYLEYSRANSTGRLLYQFLTRSNYLKKLVAEETMASEEKIKNIAKFFEMVRKFELVAREDRLIYFIQHLDMLIDAGDDPATAEADSDESAVNVLTIHKAKGLEFPIVILVSLVKGKFPWPKRGQRIAFPEKLIKDILPEGDFHIQEERRLFYVGMTRAQKELYLTSASDYGATRVREISPFVFEALGISREQVKAIKSSAHEAIARFAPLKPVKQKKKNISDDEIIELTAYKIDDYLTCPLKYYYIHELRVPIMQHHTVIYGSAMHDAVERYYHHKMLHKSVVQSEVLAWFEAVLRQEGFETIEHYKQRLMRGKEALAKFYEREERIKKIPFFLEKEFAFMVGNNRLKGRMDRIDQEGENIVVIDFKTSEETDQKSADKEAKKSRQLSLYALAYKETERKVPERVELYFLETGLIGSAKKDENDFEALLADVDQAAKGIRAQDFRAQPSYMACSFCPFNQICPYTSYH